MKIKLSLFLRLIVGLSLIFFIFYRIEWSEFIDIVTRIKPIYICIPILLFFFPGVWLSVLKWKYLLSIHDIYKPFKQLYLYYLIGSFYNNFLPTTVGGDISRVVYLNHGINKPAEITSSIIVERLTGVIALLFLALFSIILERSFVFEHLSLLHATLIFFIAIISVFLIYKYANFEKKIQKFKFLPKIKAKFTELYDSIYYYKHNTKILWVVFLLSIAFVLLGAFSTYLYFLSIGIRIPIIKLVLIYTTVQLMGLLPISINSIGITEGSYIILFGLIGINSVDALTVALLGRVLLMLVSLSGGFVFIFQDKLLKKTY